MITADFNGDGRPDLAFCATGGLMVMLNKGDGTLLPPLLYGTTPFSALAIVAIDLNGDGHPDLVALSGNLSYNAGLNVFLNRGDGTFLPAQLYSLPDRTGGATSLVVGDFNGDGKKDVAVAYLGKDYSGENAIFLNRGDGTIAFSSKFTAPGAHGLNFGISVLDDAADVNSDGVDDIITNDDGGGFSILFGRRDGTMSKPVSYSFNPNFVYAAYHFSDFRC